MLLAAKGNPGLMLTRCRGHLWSIRRLWVWICKEECKQRVSILYWLISSKSYNSRCNLNKLWWINSRITISNQMWPVTTVSKVLFILLRVSVPLQKGERLMQIAKDKPKVDSSLVRIVIQIINCSKVRMAIWWDNKIKQILWLHNLPLAIIIRDKVFLHNNSNKLNFRSNYNKFRWRGKIMGRW